jgi:hypothetical protein
MNIRSTRFRLSLVLSFLVVADGFLPEAVGAENRMAAALTPEAVWEAIDAAKDGDTVQLSAGTANWSKGESMNVIVDFCLLPIGVGVILRGNSAAELVLLGLHSGRSGEPRIAGWVVPSEK